MKYMIEYKVRHGHETEKNFASGEALLTAFSKWKPDDGLKVHTFLSSLMGDSGYVLVETDDPKLILAFCQRFAYWNETRVVPVLDVSEAASTGVASLEWARTASRR